MRRHVWILFAVLALGAGAWGQQIAAPTLNGTMSTTQISDTIYRADGTPAGGEMLIAWPAFSVGGDAVPAGKTTVLLGANGAVNFALAPNAGAMPNGSYYTVTYHLSDGTVSTEYWVVPAAGPTNISSIRSEIAPAAVAVGSQTYFQGLISSAVSGYLPLAGGTLTGPLYLSENPEQATEAATKSYVDTQVAATSTGVTSKLSLTPATTQTIEQPSQTTLAVNNLENISYAAEYQNGSGNNGIVNALTQPQCVLMGCTVTADPGYQGTDYPQGLYFSTASCQLGGDSGAVANYCGLPFPLGSRLWDQRGGIDRFAYQDPSTKQGLTLALPISDPRAAYGLVGLAREYVYAFDEDFGNSGITPEVHAMNQYAGGHNNNSIAIPGASGGKTNLFTSEYTAAYFSKGQHFGLDNNVHCTGLGDCMLQPHLEETSVGPSAFSDEGNHWGDNQMIETTHVFHGTLAATPQPSQGATALFVNVLNHSNGNQGEGRYLIDLTQAACGNENGAALTDTVNFLCSGNHLTGGAVNSNGTAMATAVAGSFPASSANTTLAQNVVNSGGNWQPGNQTVSVASNSGFAAGAACVADPSYFEIASITNPAAGTNQMTITFEYPHASGALIYQGGGCGYALVINNDVAKAGNDGALDTVRQALPLVGTSSDGTTATYWTINTTYSKGLNQISSYPSRNTDFGNVSIPNLSATYSAATGLVTVTCTACGFDQHISTLAGYTGGSLVANLTGLNVMLTDGSYSDAAYNQNVVITATSPTTFTYTPSAAPADTTVTGLTMTYCGCSYTLYPMAEVTGVYNETTKQVDGTLALANNNVAWNAGDTVEQPHWHNINVNPHNFINFIEPITTQWSAEGWSFGGRVAGNLIGFPVANNAALSNYLGYGGTDSAPRSAYHSQGWWHQIMEFESAPEESVISVGCKPSATVNGNSVGGCTSWNSGYHIFRGTMAGAGFGLFDFLPQNDQFVLTDTSASFTVNAGKSVVSALASGTSVGTCTTLPCAGLSIAGTGGTINAPNAAFASANIGTLTVTNCVGCGGSGGSGSASAGGSAGQVQVNGGSSMTGYAGLTETSSTVGIGGASYTVAESGTVNINTAASAGTTTVGNAGNTLNLTGNYVNITGSTNTVSGSTIFTSGATMSGPAATSSNAFNSSNPLRLDASVYSGTGACAIGPTLQTYMLSASSGSVQFGGAAQSCNGTAVPLYAQFASGMYTSMSLPSHVTSTNIAATGGAGTATAVAGSSGVTANWTSGTTHSDMDGSITLALAGSVSSGATLATVTFGSVWGSAPNCVFSPANAGAASAQLYLPAAGTGAFTVNAGAAVQGSPTLVLTYACHG